MINNEIHIKTLKEKELNRNVILYGFLQKKGDKGLIKSWKQRWFELYEDRIEYKVDKNIENILGNIILDAYTFVTINPSNPLQFSIQNKLRSRIYHLQALDFKERDLWINVIQNLTQKYLSDIKSELLLHKDAPKYIQIINCFITNSLYKTFLEFHMNINYIGQNNSLIIKNFFECKELHQQLTEKYPELTLPNFPSKKTFLKIQEGHIDNILSQEMIQQKNEFSFYFNSLLELPLFQMEPLIKNFFLFSQIPNQTLIITLLDYRNCSVGGSNLNLKFNLRLYDKNSNLGVIIYPLDPNNHWQKQQFRFFITSEVEGIVVSCNLSGFILEEPVMSKVNIPLKNIIDSITEISSSYVEHWFALQPVNPFSNFKNCGEIKLRMSLTCKPTNSSTLSNFPNVGEENEILKQRQYEERKRIASEKSKKYKSGEIHLKYLYNPPTKHLEGSLFISIINIRNLLVPNQTIPSPFVVLKLEDNIQQSTVKKNTQSPIYNEDFLFYIKPHSSDYLLTIKISVYDWRMIGSHELLGTLTIILSDTEIQKLHDFWFFLCSNPTEKNIPKKIGKKMKEEGYVPLLPIILIPGFASTSLKVEEGYNEWKDQRIWISLSKIGSQTLISNFEWKSERTIISTIKKQDESENDFELTSESTKKEEIEYSKKEINNKNLDENEEDNDNEMYLSLSQIIGKDNINEPDIIFRNRWLQHMSLQEDCCSDPPGIKVRPIPGLEGVSYLSPGALTNSLSYVMGPLIEELKILGYNEKNLVACGYDWRIPHHYLQQRDQFFSKLKETIEEMVKRCESKVVILAHSMGNRTTQYFLNMIKKQNGGQKWIQDHIHTFIAVGAPWLGASKALRGLITGERMGLEAFLNEKEALKWARTLGSSLCLLPFSHQHYFGDPDQINSICYMKNENKEGDYLPITIEDIMRQAGLEKHIELYKKYYLENEYFGGPADEEAILQPPPVERLYAIYGINLETELTYIFKKSLSNEIKLDSKAKWNLPNFKINKGIIYETENTKQKNIQFFTGTKGTCSGDGTVPYQSLNFCSYWKDSIPFLKIEELEKVEHRSILGNRLFFQLIIEYVAKKINSSNNQNKSDNISVPITNDISSPLPPDREMKMNPINKNVLTNLQLEKIPFKQLSSTCSDMIKQLSSIEQSLSINKQETNKIPVKQLSMSLTLPINNQSLHQHLLPPGWTSSIDSKGNIYFIDHIHKKTTYQDPRPIYASPLPLGWEISVDNMGKFYFINHIHKFTTYKDPRHS